MNSATEVSGGDVCNGWSEILKEVVKEGSLDKVEVDLVLEGKKPPLFMKGLGEKIQETLRWQVEKSKKLTSDNWIPVKQR